jgi:OOP family OmpA-OmpF porin
LIRFGNRIRHPGEYVSVFGGWSDVHDYFGGDPIQGTFNDGFLVGYTIGRRLDCNTRIEREISWRNNSVGAFNDGSGFNPAGGRINNYSTMFNLVRDFGGGKSRVRPYVGVGLGFSKQDGEIFVGGGGVKADDFAFAYQGFFGMSLKQSDRVDLYCEYRYFANTDTEVEIFGGPQLGDFAYLSESFVFGLRFKR